MKINKIVLTLLAAGMGAGLVPAAHAADADRIAQMEQQLKALQQEIDAMKKGTAKDVTELRDQLAVQSKESVVGGDIPNSFRMPNSETSLRIYGYAEADLIKDFKGTPGSDRFTNLMNQPLNNSNPTQGKTALTAETSRIGFETSTPTAVGPIHTQVEGDFYSYCTAAFNGGNCSSPNNFRLRVAYGEYAGWMIGQNWSTFMDLDDGPETVDFNGPIGMPFSRPVQIRYTYALATGETFKAALENPTDGATRPNVVLFAGKTGDWGGVNARVISHEQRGVDATGNSISKSGTGFGLGGQYKLTSDLTLMGQWAKVDGDNDNSLMMGANYPVISAGSMLLDKSSGFVLGLTNVFSEKLRATFAYGRVQSQLNSSDPYAVASAAVLDSNNNPVGLGSINKTLAQWHLNFIYTPIKNVDLGAELIGGTRTTFAGDKGDLSRMNLLARYSFN